MSFPPPAASVVYELTENGRAMEPVLRAMLRFGIRLLGPPREGDHVEPDWFALAAEEFARRDASPERRFELRLHNDEREASIRSEGGAEGTRLLRADDDGPVDLSIRMPVIVAMGLASGSLPPEAVAALPGVELEGDRQALERLPPALRHAGAARRGGPGLTGPHARAPPSREPQRFPCAPEPAKAHRTPTRRIPMSLKLTGAGLSPFVRKVRVALTEKGLEYEHVPMMPVGVPDEYKAKHPLGKIPLLEDGDRVIPDSSSALVYLEGIRPEPALFPSDPYERARAVWLEELGDSGLVNVAAVGFQENVLAKAVFQREPDPERIRQNEAEAVPPIFDYLERTLGDEEYFVGGRFSVADIGIGAPLAQYSYGGGEIDAGRWPKLATYAERVLSRPSFKELVAEDRAALKEMAGG